MKKTLTLTVILVISLVLTGCGPSNSQDNIHATKGGIRGLIFGDEVTANGTGVNQAPESLGAHKSNTQIRKDQKGTNSSLIEDDRSFDNEDRRGSSRRESRSLLD
jgi:hypothetical protein